MKENRYTGGWYAWPVIILTLCFFWPVGLYLLIKRLSVDKKSALGVGKAAGIVGGAFYLTAIVGILAGFTDGFSFEDWAMILLSAAGGFVLCRAGKKLRKEAALAKQYLAILNGNVRRMDSIASITGKPYDTVKADLQELISRGYLENAYINESTGEIVLLSGSVPPAPAARVVTCPCCGANNTLYGPGGRCEYCGSPIGGR